MNTGLRLRVFRVQVWDHGECRPSLSPTEPHVTRDVIRPTSKFDVVLIKSVAGENPVADFRDVLVDRTVCPLEDTVGESCLDACALIF